MDKRSKKPVTSDPRFSRVHSDPRFRLPKKKEQKHQIDDRFKEALKDDRFKVKATRDKYGRKITSSKEVDEAKKYAGYESESGSEDEEEADEKSKAQKETSDDDSESEDEDSNALVDKARGEGVSESESSSDSDSSDESDAEIEDDQTTEDAGLKAPGSEETIPTGEETSVFAVVNLDWDNVRAIDLMASFSSFVPPQGRILSVDIYPSEYGKEQMAKEELEGPSKQFFDKKTDEEDKEINEKTIFEEGNEEDYNSSTLRKYQLQRLRYYYAVVRCDSVSTAKYIYDNCDGLEFEATANFFDLRYVPEDMEFEDTPKDHCTKVPADFKPNQFVTDALQHSNVRLTWDETPAERRKVTHRNYSQKELDQMDLDAYIASASESEDNDQSNKIALLKKAAGKVKGVSKQDSDGEVDSDGSEGAGGDGNIEITFNPDEENAGNDKSDDEETTLEAYKRKQKERKQKRLAKIKAEKDAAQAEEEESGKKGSKSKKNKKKHEDSLEARKNAEMELLAMDDEIDAAEATKQLEKTTGDKKQKRKTRKKQKEEERAALDTEIPTTDDRFSQMFSDPAFAIDTTSSQYKKSKGTDKLMQERRKRHQTGEDGDRGNKKRKKQGKFDNGGDVNVDSIVNKLKMRGQSGR